MTSRAPLRLSGERELPVPPLRLPNPKHLPPLDELASYEAMVQRWIDSLAGLPGVTAERRYPSEAGQPHSRAIVHLGPGSRLGRTELVAALWDADPRIAVSEVDSDAIALNPQTLEPGEDQLVLDALRRLL